MIGYLVIFLEMIIRLLSPLIDHDANVTGQTRFSQWPCHSLFPARPRSATALHVTSVVVPLVPLLSLSKLFVNSMLA